MSVTLFASSIIAGCNVSSNVECISNDELPFGRRLFVDESWVEQTNMEKVYHNPTYHTANPILKSEMGWEFNAKGDPYAAPFSGGVWYDELDSKFKMWYSAGGELPYGMLTCYAESNDGIAWYRPMLDIVPNTNIVDTTPCDCVSVTIDKYETDMAKRYKMFIIKFNPTMSYSMQLKYSSDGIHWGESVALSGEINDRGSVYWDPFRDRYVMSMKSIKNPEYGRVRSFIEHEDLEMLVSLAHRVYDGDNDKFIKYWFNAEDDDPHHPDFPDLRPQIYNHEAVAYENRMLGYFTIWQGPENDDCDRLNIQKRNEILLGWSKDGFNWNRDNKLPFMTVSSDPKAWNAGNIQSTNGNPIIVGDSLYFYLSGRYESKPIHDSNFSTGMSTLRRDGFVSMSSSADGGYLITPPMRITGPYLFVNANMLGGKLNVELLDSNDKPINGFAKNDFISFENISSTKVEARWTNADLNKMVGKEVKVKFYVDRGELYSFWTSKWESGESEGYTSAGGPGLHPSGRDLPLN